MVKSHYRQAALIALFGQPISPMRETLLDHVVGGKVHLQKAENMGWAQNIYEDPSLPYRQIEDQELRDYETATLNLVKKAISISGTTYWQPSDYEWALLCHYASGIILRDKELFNSSRPQSGKQIAEAYSKHRYGKPLTMIETLVEHLRTHPFQSQSAMFKLSIGITNNDVPICFDVPFYDHPSDLNTPQGNMSGFVQPLARRRVLIAERFLGEDKKRLDEHTYPRNLLTRIKLVDFRWREPSKFYDWMVYSALKNNRKAKNWAVNPGSGQALLQSIRKMELIFK